MSTTLPEPRTPGRYRVAVVCLGNICRSPMAHVVLEDLVEKAGLADRVEVVSSGTGGWHVGAPMDRRAAKVLGERGYRSGDHRARQITADEIAAADLVIAMEDIHTTKMLGLCPAATNLTLLSDYDPSAEPGSGVPDPWYGTPAGFYGTLEAIESAIPGVLDRVRALQSG